MNELRAHLPQQQGLRQVLSDLFEVEALLRDHLPLKQGLRHFTGFITRYILLRDHLPLKQGLGAVFPFFSWRFVKVYLFLWK